MHGRTLPAPLLLFIQVLILSIPPTEDIEGMRRLLDLPSSTPREQLVPTANAALYRFTFPAAILKISGPGKMSGMLM